MKSIKKLTIASSLAFALCALPLAACNDTTPPVAEIEPAVPAQPASPEQPVLPTEPQDPPVQSPEEHETPVPTVSTPVPLKEQYIYVDANSLNVRAGAGTSYASLGKAERGILLSYEGTQGDWHRTKYQNKTAYVSAAYTHLVSLTVGEGDAERVIQVGLNLLGVPYVYGATRLHDGKGNMIKGFSDCRFDCSSLMQYLFYEGAGQLLDVTTRTQILQGKHVDREDVARGDLLFFTNASRYYNKGIERVGHVALYLGDNYILHTSSDYAKIEQISQQRWNYFIEARRILL